MCKEFLKGEMYINSMGHLQNIGCYGCLPVIVGGANIKIRSLMTQADIQAYCLKDQVPHFPVGTLF